MSRVLADVRALYLATLGEPGLPGYPSGEDDFEESVAEVAQAESARCSLAYSSGVLVGFCYGFMLQPDHGWWRALEPATPMPDTFWSEAPGRTYTLQDMGVRSELRRRGIGQRLIAEILATVDAERVVVSIQPTNEPIRRLLLSTGWALLGRNGPLEGVVPEYWDLYWLELTGVSAGGETA